MATTTVLQPGAKIADFLVPPKSPQWFVDNGFSAVACYVKNVNPAWIAAWHAVGLGVVLIHENSVSESLGGALAAKKYGPKTRAKLDQLGYPADCPVSVVAQDTGVGYGPSSYPAVRAYFKEMARILGRPMWDYGGTTLGGEACSGITLGTWRAAAGSWSLKHPERVAVRQGFQVDGYDPNTVVMPTTVWLPHDDPTPPPPPPIPTIAASNAALTEDDMALRFVGPQTPAAGVDPRTRWLSNGMVRTTPTEESAAWAINKGLTQNTLDTADMLTDAELAGLPLVQ